MNDTVIEWAKALNSLSVEYIAAHSTPSNWAYEIPDGCQTHVGLVVVHLGGHRLVIRHDFDLMALHISEDDALFDMLDITNFEEAVRILTL